MNELQIQCRLCGGSSCTQVGLKKGSDGKALFSIINCSTCNYIFVGNPRTDYANIYNESYYHGEGADPKVDYVGELNNPETTVRCYEWDGVLRVVQSLLGSHGETRWLDFGCGNGGLVRAGLQAGLDIRGFEEGWIAEHARSQGIPILRADQLEGLAGTMDVVTAIEVLEHVIDPNSVLRQIRALLKPGGLFFATTGNADKFRNDLLSWSYILPDIHVGFFGPGTLAEALRRNGFAPEWHGFAPGFADIIRFKVLKNLGVRSRGGLEKIVPWSLISRIVNLRYGVTAQPVGRAI